MRIIKRNKKLIALLTIMVMSIGVLNGCGQSNVNQEYNQEGMVNLDGTKHKYDDENFKDSVLDKDSGVGILYTKYVKQLMGDGRNRFFVAGLTPYGLEFLYQSEEKNKVYEEFQKNHEGDMTEEEEKELDKKTQDMSFPYAAVYRVQENKKDDSEVVDYVKQHYKNIEKLASIKEDTYYFAYNTDYSKLKLSTEEKEDVKNLVSELKLLKKNICLFPAPAIDQNKSNKKINGNINKFNAKTLDGKDITEDSFKDYDITMINIWATFCGPCKDEMKELAELYESLPKNVNMTTICTDAKDEPKLAKEIIDSAKGKFKVIIPDDKLNESLLDKVGAVPTTIFVDKAGNLIGDPIVGAAGKKGEVAAAYMNEINKRLESIGK